MRSKKIKRDKNYVSKTKVEPKVAKVSDSKPKHVKVDATKPKVDESKPRSTKVEESKPKVSKVEESKPRSTKVEVKPTKTTKSPKSKPRTSPDLLNKHGYNITNRSVDRQNSLGKLVILYGVTELIKKIDSISVDNPNLSDKYNDDKRWVKDNFKSKRSVKKS
jgi:hypothetical protein